VQRQLYIVEQSRFQKVGRQDHRLRIHEIQKNSRKVPRMKYIHRKSTRKYIFTTGIYYGTSTCTEELSILAVLFEMSHQKRFQRQYNLLKGLMYMI
jgi:hypothetical protein